MRSATKAGEGWRTPRGRHDRWETQSDSPRHGGAWAWDVMILIGLASVSLAVQLWVMGRIPSGSDSGNWLALARELAGEDVMSADVHYPPLVPALLAGLLQVLSPLKSLAVVSILSRVLLITAVYLTARTLGRVLAVSTVVLASFAGYQLEIHAFGGYPQILGSAFAVGTLACLARGLVKGEFGWYAAAFVAGLLGVLTHDLASVMIVGGLPIVMFIAIVAFRVQAGRGSLTLALATWTSLAAVWLGRLPSQMAGGQPNVNPQGYSAGDIPFLVSWFVREQRWVWAVVSLSGLAAVLGVRRLGARSEVVAPGIALVGVSVGFFVLMLEPRALAFSQIGLALLAGAAASLLVKHKFPMAKTAAAGMALVAVLAALGGIGRYSDSVLWFRIVEVPEIRTLSRFGQVSAPGDRVMATTGPHGFPLGWWIEGYAGRPTFTAGDPDFMTFDEERVQATLANQFFETDDPRKAREVLTEQEVVWIVVDRRSPQAGWLDSAAGASFLRIIDTPTLVLLDAS